MKKGFWSTEDYPVFYILEPDDDFKEGTITVTEDFMKEYNKALTDWRRVQKQLSDMAEKADQA